MDRGQGAPKSVLGQGILSFPAAEDDEDDQLWTMDKQVIKRRYELLCQLQARLHDLVPKLMEQRRASNAAMADRRRTKSGKKRKSRKRVTGGSSDSEHSNEQTIEPPVNAWVCTQARSDMSHSQKLKGAGILKLVDDRETGSSWGLGLRSTKVGNRARKWSSTLQGWDSLESQFKGPGVRLEHNFYSSWTPTWSAYSSNVAPQTTPNGRPEQGVQKILDVRFHPSGSPQLVCGCNAAPNELLLYDLISGKSRPLTGHNCQVQAVEYAADLIVSCGYNILKVWDSSTAACLHTLGPGSIEGNVAGHTRKITAMAVNSSQPCLIATSGGQGDGQILLWNVSRGSLVSELNSISRRKRELPPMDALEFCNENFLLCGSDSLHGQPAVVQIWDLHTSKETAVFFGNATYITCVKTNPAGTLLITGSGDGTVGLFDLRSSGAIGRFPVGVSCEVTSAGFSACGRYLQASSTENNTIVWDTRLMPLEPGNKSTEFPPVVANPNARSTRPLHCLSHGKPMPTSDNTSQRAGVVDVGDQGVNDARWFENSPVLVTVSGNGTIALWDVTLGQPCVRHLQSHTRCINTVAVSRNDEYLCSGGDDQKLVLYENVSQQHSSRGWRLTHPLCDSSL